MLAMQKRSPKFSYFTSFHSLIIAPYRLRACACLSAVSRIQSPHCWFPTTKLVSARPRAGLLEVDKDAVPSAALHRNVLGVHMVSFSSAHAWVQPFHLGWFVMAETASAPVPTGLREAGRAALHFAAVQQCIVVYRLYVRWLFLVPVRGYSCFIPSSA
jgi:hypothetical protein